MPIYLYQAKSKTKACAFCKNGFEWFVRSGSEDLKRCPHCGTALAKLPAGFAMGFSRSGMDRKAKEKGFHKLKKVDKGKYEKLY